MPAKAGLRTPPPPVPLLHRASPPRPTAGTARPRRVSACPARYGSAPRSARRPCCWAWTIRFRSSSGGMWRPSCCWRANGRCCQCPGYSGGAEGTGGPGAAGAGSTAGAGRGDGGIRPHRHVGRRGARLPGRAGGAGLSGLAARQGVRGRDAGSPPPWWWRRCSIRVASGRRCVVAGGQRRAGAVGPGSWQGGVASAALPDGGCAVAVSAGVAPGLFRRERKLLELPDRSFSTLTNTWYTGRSDEELLRFGRSKEGRSTRWSGAVAWCGVPAGVRGSGGGCVGAVDAAGGDGRSRWAGEGGKSRRDPTRGSRRRRTSAGFRGYGCDLREPGDAAGGAGGGGGPPTSAKQEVAAWRLEEDEGEVFAGCGERGEAGQRGGAAGAAPGAV